MSELRGYIPGFTLSSGKSDDRRGDGLVIHSDLGTTIVIDGFDGSSPSIALIDHLKKNHYNDIDALILTHPHYDHYKGLLMMMEDNDFTIKQFDCYDPESIKFGIGNSSNGRAVKEDYDNFIKIINLAKSKNIVVKYLTTGSNPTIGDIKIRVWRKQPTKFTENDGGNAYAFINDGSLCLYFPDLKMLVSGDGPQNLKQAIAYFKGQVKFIKIPHHGNNLTQSNAAAAKSAGCILAYETNIERNGPGTTGFTAYGTKRAREQGIPVLMQNYDITFTASNKKMTVYQNNKSWSYDVDYGITGEWIQDFFGYKYKENDKFITNTAYLIAGYWYYFDNKGYTIRGWHKANDGLYRFLKSPRGEMQINTWVCVNKRWFFVDGYGRMLTGWQQLPWSGGKDWFYFDYTGAMRTGLLELGQEIYYCLPENGVMLKNSWQNVDGKWYYFEGYGRAVKGWQQLKWSQGTNWFYFNEKKHMVTGWHQLAWSKGTNWFYFDDNGVMKTGWYQDPGDKKWRYLDLQYGFMLIKQWLTLDGKTYYLDGYGRMLQNTIEEIDGKEYTFDENGVVQNKESDKEFKIFFINHERFTTSNNWGDNCLIESDGKFILMDTCMPNGEDAILKFLKTRGVNKLSLYISHAHMDHYGNAMALLIDSYFTIEHLYMNKYGQIWDIDNSNVQMHYKNMKKIGEYAKSKGIPITWLQKGAKWNIGSAQFEILYDAPMNISQLGEGGRDLLNNLSPVCMITLGDVKYLSCGDAGKELEAAVLKEGIDVNADIWKMQHHGGNEGNTLAWVKAISPQYAVYNNGEGSIGKTDWTKGSIQNAHSVGAKVYNPTYHGNIIFTIKGQTINVWSERNTDKY